MSGSGTATPVRLEVRGRSHRLPPGPRRALLLVHILSSVGLAGIVATVLAIAVAGGGPATYQLMPLLVHTLGIPLSLLALTSGVLIAWRTAWGLFQHGWIVVKLMLLLAVLACGALMLEPATDRLLAEPDAGGTRALVIGGLVFQLLALTASSVLSVFKPRRLLPGTR